MDAVSSAKNLIRQYEEMEDLDMMAHAKAGESRRAHDFIRVDLPIMLDVAEGRNPHERANLSERQAALLELTPGDMADKIDSDMSSARRVLGWVAPFAKDETKDFVLNHDSFGQELRDGLVTHQKAHAEADRSAGYSNDPEAPLDTEMFNNVREQLARSGYYRPGDSVISPPRDREPDEDPYSFPQQKVEEIRLSRVSENSASFFESFKLEGESDFRKQSELIDPRGTEHGYGVVAEAAGRLYYVQTENPFGKIEPENMIAREIAGVEKSMTDRIEHEILESRNDSLQNGLYSQEDIHGPQIAPTNKREVLGFDSDTKEPIAGEFTYHGTDGANDRHGPIVIEANSWSSGTGQDEREWANLAIRRHLEKHEFPSSSIAEQAEANRQTSFVTRGEPTSETIRHGNQQAAMAAAMGQGF